MQPLIRGLICALACAAPLAAQADLLGERLYSNYCAACHGARGEGHRGQGVMGDQSGPALNRLAAANDGVFPTRAVAAYVGGTNVPRGHESAMPVWQEKIGELMEASPLDASQEADAWITSIVRHIETLQVGG